ncbi:hypothetical protein RHMOL_Rhmol11G0172200 [Rhododendron molle]|uniref:Uncharacterized protein n=1 Tax=Rhododendron molle TaxID=49168 RepID=A0ACC0LTF4_RHOML|nr:hypothetical protein RHMOL_Rhmol11G0172200 [Rhododendron molle]
MVIVGDRAVPMTSTFGSTHFRPSAFGSQCGGSRVAGYSKTVEEVDVGKMGSTGPQQLESISAMPVYKDKSTEQLRWEDYKSGDKGGIGFGAWAMRPNLFTASCLSAKSASNPFSSSTPANIFASKTGASASEGFGESNTPAFSSFSPFGHSSSIPFSSDFGASTAPAPSSTPFQASAWPFATTSSSTLMPSGKPSASGLFGPNRSEPSLCTSSLPTFGPKPAVFSSSGSFSANCYGTSTQPIFGANNKSSEFFGGEPISSMSSHFGSVPPNFVSPSLFGQATAQVPVSQSVAPLFGISGGCCCVCPSNMLNTAFTGNGSASAGNLFSSTQIEFPPNLSGFGHATASSPSPFKPMQTVPCTGVPIGDFGQSVHGTSVPVGNFGQSVPGFNGFLGIAYLPCWIAFGQPVASPPGWVASAQPIAAPVTCNNPFHREVAGAPTPTYGSTNFGQSAFSSKRGGSRVEAYKATADQVEFGKLNSISAMPIYLNKSPEEIRSEDYQSGDKGGPTLRMGSVHTAPSSFSSSTPSNLFASQKPTFTCQKIGLPTTPIFGSSGFAAPSGECQFGQSFATPFSSTSANLFGSQTPVFNSADLASSTPFGPRPFGQPSANPVSSSTSTNSFAASQTPSFASPAFGASTTTPSAFASKRRGSRVEAYKATADPVEFGKLNSISAMPIYLNKSPEEIRSEDYQSGDKGGPTLRMGSVHTAPSSFSSSTPSNLFASQKPTFTCQKFGVPTTPIFGSSGFAAPSGECQFGQSFATPFSSTSANLFGCQTPAFNSADLASSTPFGPRPFSQPSTNPFSSSTSTNSFAASQTPSFALAAFGASTSATTPLASSVFAAPSSPSPFGLSVNPFSSSTPSNTFPPKTSSFGSSGFGESTACPFTTAPSTLWGFGTASGFGSGANGSAPSFIESSSPTFGSSPSVCSSSFTFGTSSQPVSGSHSYPLFGTLNSSVSSLFGSVAPNSVSPSSSGPISAQSLFHAKCHPSFQKTHPFCGESNIPLTPSFIPYFGALNISSTASTGNGSEGNLCSSPTSAAGFDPTTGMALVGMPSVHQVLQLVDFEDIGRAQH